jgi:hypothetical protein
VIDVPFLGSFSIKSILKNGLGLLALEGDPVIVVAGQPSLATLRTIVVGVILLGLVVGVITRDLGPGNVLALHVVPLVAGGTHLDVVLGVPADMLDPTVELPTGVLTDFV